MITRIVKLLLLSALALFYTLVVFNNATDFDSNYQFVRHVLMMDSTFPGNKGMWRAVNESWLHLSFYLGIIGWEMVIVVLNWWGVAALYRQLRSSAEAFNEAKGVAMAAVALGMLLWMGAFITVGGEWFLMWQSRAWNGQEAAFRMFVIAAIVLFLILQPERDEQP